MRKTIRIAARMLKSAMACLAAAAAIAAAAVVCFGLRLPGWAVERISRNLSNESFAVRIDSVSFRLPGSLRISGVRVFDRRKIQAQPFLSAAQADVSLAVGRLPWRLERMVSDVKVRGLSFPRLPDGYYIPDSVEFPGQPDFREVNAPLDMEFPRIAPFRLTLVRPDVLSVRPEQVVVASVESRRRQLRFSGISLRWPDIDVDMALDGEAVCDVLSQRAYGNVHGQARQRNIRPMLQTLDITNCYQFIDAFTGVSTPVDATCQFDVNLANSDLHIFLDLHPTGGSYRGVPFVDAHGLVDVRVFVRDTYQNAKIVVGPVTANFPGGGTMEGTVEYENTNDIGYVSFDVRSTVSLSNALAVADVLTDGTLDCLQPETPPEIYLKGMMAVDPANCETNDIRGTLEFLRGTFFSVPLANARTAFRVKGAEAVFREARANTPGGGELSGTGSISFPGFSREKSRFRVEVSGRKILMADAGRMFHVDTGGRKGRVEGDISLEGALAGDVLQQLTGEGEVAIKEGDLARLDFLSALFDAMERLPGFASFVRQSRETTGITVSEAALRFKLSGGTISAEKLEFRGGIFIITCAGTYDIARDKLDIAASVKIVKDDSLLGMLKNPVFWPFSKLSTMLFGFKASGSLHDPKWVYDTAILKRFR